MPDLPSGESVGRWGERHPERHRVFFLQVVFGLCWVELVGWSP